MDQEEAPYALIRAFGHFDTQELDPTSFLLDKADMDLEWEASDYRNTHSKTQNMPVGCFSGLPRSFLLLLLTNPDNHKLQSHKVEWQQPRVLHISRALGLTIKADLNQQYRT